MRRPNGIDRLIPSRPKAVSKAKASTHPTREAQLRKRGHRARRRLHDLMRLRTESGPANMATIRHAALDIIEAIPDQASLEVRRKTIGWDDDYLANAIAQRWP